MTIDFYYTKLSPPCRAVLLAAKVIRVELTLKPIDLHQQEYLTPEYVGMNPQHTIPTINDNGFVVWESRAIITYLQNQYGKDDSLYPKDPKKRALVDQRLFFDLDLYSKNYQLYNRETLRGKPLDPEKLQQVNKNLEFLDIFLGQTEYVAGDNLTLADLAVVVNISNLEVVNHNLTPYKNINIWLAKMKATVPGYEDFKKDYLVILKQRIESFSKEETR